MRRGEVYLVSLNPSIGHEQQGTRPVLVVSADAFNKVTRMPMIVQITSGGAYARNAGFAVSLEAAGTQTVGFILCNQLRSLDVAARGGRRLESVPSEIVDDVLARLATFLE